MVNGVTYELQNCVWIICEIRPMAPVWHLLMLIGIPFLFLVSTVVSIPAYNRCIHKLFIRAVSYVMWWDVSEEIQVCWCLWMALHILQCTHRMPKLLRQQKTAGSQKMLLLTIIMTLTLLSLSVTLVNFFRSCDETGRSLRMVWLLDQLDQLDWSNWVFERSQCPCYCVTEYI